MEQAAGCRILAAPARHARRHEVRTLNLAVRIVPVAAGQKLTADQGRVEAELSVAPVASGALPAVHGRRGSCLRCRWPGKMDQPARQAPAEVARYAPAMSGFPWTSLITAVVPAAAVLAGAALTGRQNNQAGRTAALKADYAGFVQAVTSLIEHRERISRAEARGSHFALALEAAAREAAARDMDVQLASAVERARAVVDLAGSYTARRGAFLVSVQADLAGDSGAAGDLATALEEFLKAVRSEVGGESRPGLKWRIRMILRRD